MRTKRKVSVTIDEELYEAIETAAKKRQLTKSQVAREAFGLWLRKQTEALMAKGYEHMADENSGIAELTFEAQKEVLK